jgi:S1-C subfamily serine protease
VAGAETVDVHFYDGSMTTGTIGQTQPDRDLAVVNVRRLPRGVEAATLSGGARPGDKIMTIGAPGGFDGTVTSGIISAIGRRFTVEETGQTLTDLIQFDAPINPGNSGGPLVDFNGRVIGIISSRIDQFGNRDVQGIGFAVPIESASGIFAPLG